MKIGRLFVFLSLTTLFTITSLDKIEQDKMENIQKDAQLIDDNLKQLKNQCAEINNLNITKETNKEESEQETPININSHQREYMSSTPNGHKVKVIDLRIPPCPDHIKNKWEKGIDWTLNHIDVINGWSLTGYAKTGMTEDFNMYRWKFGLVNGELELYKKMDDWYPKEDWEIQPEKPIIGFVFTREF